MPLYLDVHNKIEGLTMLRLRVARTRRTLRCRANTANYIHWHDEGTGKVFCLVEAPSKEAARRLSPEATAWSPTRSSR